MEWPQDQAMQEHEKMEKSALHSQGNAAPTPVFTRQGCAMQNRGLSHVPTKAALNVAGT